MSRKGSLKLRVFLKKLRPYGVIPMPAKGTSKRGKGSEIILIKPNEPGSKQGPQYPIKNHGPGTEINLPVINAALRRFAIDEEEFWK